MSAPRLHPPFLSRDGIFGFVHPEAGWESSDADVDAEWLAVGFESDGAAVVTDAQGCEVEEQPWMQRGIERFREMWFEEMRERWS